MTNFRPVGIDLGTTNSAVAWVDQAGRTAMVPNAEGDLLTPSVVLFDDDEVVVGKEARNATIVNPDRVAVWVKRDMGAPVYNRPIRGEYLPPEVIQACILRKLNTDVVHLLGPECRVVITVPAYFDEPRRKATADAGEMAGLSVLDIVNEPTAGALAFGEALGYLTPGAAARQEMNVMVYDLGGGTFDVTLLRLAQGRIETIATDGDVQLGGYDWDLRVVEYVAKAFQQVHGYDPRGNAQTISRLFAAATEAKHTLSARSHTVVRLDHAGQSLEVPISRQQFEEMTSDLLERTAYTTRQMLAAAHMQWRDVARILLVGGSTRMPAVPQMLRQMTGITPDHTVNPDEAVARGAALYADYLLAKRSGTARPPSFEVTNVNAHSLGVEGIEPQTLRKTNVIVIPRNTSLPAKVTERFCTKSDGQRSIVVQILEGESTLPGECTAIGRTVIQDLPVGLPKGWPIEVTFEYGTNGRLTVDAVVPGTNREVKLALEREVGLSTDGISRWKRAMASSGGYNVFESMLLEVLGLPGAKVASGPMGPKAAAAVAAAAAGWPTTPPAAAPGMIPAMPGAAPGMPGMAPQPVGPMMPVSAETMLGAIPMPAGMAPAAAPAAMIPLPPPRRPKLLSRGRDGGIPRLLFNVVGYTVASGIGLALAYLLLNFLKIHFLPGSP